MKFFASLFKRDELQRRGITIDEEVGHGTYSKVYKGRLRRSEEEQIPIAIKIIDIKTSPVDFIKRFLPREINISKLVNHSNLLTTISDFETNGKHYIVTELARFDLLQYLRLKGPLRETLARRLFYELISGINHLHVNNIVHRDIKCENLLISLDGSLKVADFGFARQIDKHSLSETYCGSTAYTAPEVLEAKFPYDPKQSDTWSCGVIMYILLAGTMPFSKNQLFTIVKSRTVQISLPLPISAKTTEIASNMMKSILHFEPDRRPKLNQLIRDHPWFTKDIRDK